MKPLPQLHVQIIEQAILAAQAAGDLPQVAIPAVEVRSPKKAEQGDYACAVAMQLAKPTGMNPFEVAQKIAARLGPAPFIESAEVVKPGFLNFRLSKDWLRAQVEAIIAEGERLFQLDIGQGQRAQVEFVSANPTGPVTVGRSRGAIVGDSIARVLEAAGYDVEREYYFNNAGVQMFNLGNSLRLRYLDALGRPVDIPSKDDPSFYQGAYLQDFAADLVREEGDSLADADWRSFKEYAENKMFEWIKTTLARVNIHHNVFFNENSLYDSGAVEETLSLLDRAGYVYRAIAAESNRDASTEDAEEDTSKGAATWFRSSALGDAKDRVLVKSDGSPTYTLPDIAYHRDKFGRGFDLLVNVLGADHGTQFRVVRCGLEALGINPEPLHVIIVQMVRTVKDGKEVRMSTRRGVFDTLDELIDMTSPDVVRYLLLARSPDSHLNFDLDMAVKQSNENPVYYIQNAHVRCAGIFREAEARGLSDEGADLSLLGDAELQFLRKALELGEVIEQASATLEPHRLAFYAHELAAVFHPIYDEVRALHSDVPPDIARARLRFYRAAHVVFKRVLALMGMTAPERM